MKVIQLLTGAAAAALVAGAASAYTVVLTDTGLGAFAPTTDEVTSGPIDLASEAASGGASATFHVFVEQTLDGVFTTDDVLVTVNLSGGVFAAAVGNNNLEAQCATSGSLSEGGVAGTGSATFLVSGLDTCDGSPAGPGAPDVGALGFALPITLDGTSDLTVEIAIETDSNGTPVDQSPESLAVVDIAPAYTLTVAPAGNDPLADLDVVPIYTQFNPASTTEAIGVVELACDTTRDVDLVGTAVDCTADVAGLDVTIDGDLVAYTLATGDVEVGGVSASSIAANEQSADVDISALVAAPTGTGAQNIDLTVDGVDPINPSTYSATIALDLVAGFVDPAPVTAAIDPVDREGTEVVFAWTPGTAVATANGSANVFRLGNMSDAPARVFVEVLNNSDAAFVTPGIIQNPTDLPARGELVFTSDTLTTLIADDWGRGDVRFSIELAETDATARRFVRDQTGALTELGAGTVAEDLDG